MHLTDQSAAGEESKRATRRAEVEALTIKGKRPHEIAAEIGVPLDVILEDQQSLSMKWHERAARPVVDILAEQLASLDQMQREAWTAWERSWNPQSRTTKSRKTAASSGYVQVTKAETDQLGDTKYLTLVLNCIDRRCNLLNVKGPIASEDESALNIAAMFRVADGEMLGRISQGFLTLEQLINAASSDDERPLR